MPSHFDTALKARRVFQRCYGIESRLQDGMRVPYLFQKRLAMPEQKRFGQTQRFRFALDDQGQIEQITRRGSIPTVIHLLGNDLCRLLHPYGVPVDAPHFPRIVQQIGSGNKVHLPLVKLEFDERVRGLGVILRQARSYIAQSRRDKPEVLRIGYKDVDVFAKDALINSA